MKTITHYLLALLITACLSCKNNNQDLLIGKWNWEKYSYESPVGAAKTYQTNQAGSYITFANNGSFEQKQDGLLFNANWKHSVGSTTEFIIENYSNKYIITQLDKHTLIFYSDIKDVNNNTIRYYSYLNR
ncbi:MAG: hypothetical protein ACKOWL_02675 [Sphingobacteriaceae bacterium]